MLYDYQCKTCGDEKEEYHPIAERNTHAPVCCGQRMEIIIKRAPMGFVDRDIHYKCPVTGTGVTSRRQRNEIMARNGLVDANDITPAKMREQKAEKARVEALKKDIAKDLASETGKIFKEEQQRFMNEMSR